MVCGLEEIVRLLLRARSVAVPDERDVALYQSILDSQVRSMEQIDAILSATGVLIFSAMTYLLSTDEVRTGIWIARALALAMLIPVAMIGIAIVRYAELDAPDLADFDADLRRERSSALQRARQSMADASYANRETIRIKKRLRLVATFIGAALFLTDLLGFVVHW